MEELLLNRKIEEMIQYGYTCLRKFPKTERYTLAADIKTCMYQALRLAISAARKHHRKTVLHELDVEMEMLRALVRTAKDLTFLPFKQYEHWQRMNVEIGRMVGGWLRSVHSQADARHDVVSPSAVATATTVRSAPGTSTSTTIRATPTGTSGGARYG